MDLRRHIIRKGMEQRTVAATLGWPVARLNLYLHGRRTLPAQAVMPLAEALGVTAEDVLAHVDLVRKDRPTRKRQPRS